MRTRNRNRRTGLALSVAALLALVACPHEESGEQQRVPQVRSSYRPPPKRAEITAEMLADRAAVRSPADGGGRAWLQPAADGTPAAARVRTLGTWVLIYEAGELGVATGGTVLLQIGPYWNWDDPQLDAPDQRGYTVVTSEAEGVELECDVPGRWSLGTRIRGRALAAGERIRIEYGAEAAGARADDWAEREARFWLRVDGDGDGISGLLANSPTLDVGPGPPAHLLLHLSSTPERAADGTQSARLCAALVDAWGDATSGFSGTLQITDLPAALVGPRELQFGGKGLAAGELVFSVRQEGVHRVRARVTVPALSTALPPALSAGEPAQVLEAESNPLLVDGKQRILWGDLHGHSNLSDGTGTPEDWYRYARRVAGLDLAVLTDHDHWGMQFLDEHPQIVERIAAATRAADQPGRFTSLQGYEWTSWLHGHRHVLFFDDDLLLLSSLDESVDDPAELWAALRGRPALTFAHHSAGGPIATDWSFPPDPVLEPVTEIVSVHGSSEAADSPLLIYAPIAGNFVRDQLGRGLILGFVGSGDGHDGRPGLTHLLAPGGGLAAVHAEENTRSGILAALRARSCYATSGPRIVLRAELAGQPMGARIDARSLGDTARCDVRVATPGALLSLDLIRNASVVETFPCSGVRDVRKSFALNGLHAGDFVYVRAVQEDGHFACSSPFFVE